MKDNKLTNVIVRVMNRFVSCYWSLIDKIFWLIVRDGKYGKYKVN